MKQLKFSLSILCCIFAMNAFCFESSVKNYIPQSPVNAQEMILSISKKDQQELELIVAKFQKALANDPEWFMEHTTSLPEGQLLPYDPKMGITKAEYQQILTMNKEIKLVKGKCVKLIFTSLSDNKVKITTDDLQNPLNNIVIGDKDTGITTRYGQLTEFNNINNADPNAITGPWKGVQWGIQSSEKDFKEKGFAKNIKFAIGKLENEKQGIIYFNVLDVDNKHKDQFDYIVFYPL